MLTKLFRQTAVPPEYRANFLHLYLDIGFFGVLSGSAVNFLNIYATRIGATGLQIGLIGAMSAIVNLFLAIPTGHWLQTQSTGKAIFWSSVFYRSGFFAFILLPWLFNETSQVVAIILITFLMAIPFTVLGVGFNALFAEAVPAEYRAHVAGIRNVMFALTFMLTSLISGYILDQVTFPIGYQIVFGIGAVGAAMSSYHLYFVSPLQTDTPAPLPHRGPASSQNTFSLRGIFSSLRLDIWKTNFKRVLIGLFALHVTRYLAIPIFPLFNVRILNLSDNEIGIGTALFYLTALLGSTQLRKFAHKIGNQNVTGWGVVGLAFYPFLLALSSNVWHFYGVSLYGGFVFAMINGAFANYMLEHIPTNDRPSHLAWYTIILNAAILIGSLGGPAFANVTGLAVALMVFALLRLIAGIIILKWG